jgi:hypothetical protein
MPSFAASSPPLFIIIKSTAARTLQLPHSDTSAPVFFFSLSYILSSFYSIFPRPILKQEIWGTTENVMLS